MYVLDKELQMKKFLHKWAPAGFLAKLRRYSACYYILPMGYRYYIPALYHRHLVRYHFDVHFNVVQSSVKRRVYGYEFFQHFLTERHLLLIVIHSHSALRALHLRNLATQ